MRAGERTYVATAFVPFTWRRADAVATQLVAALRDAGIDAERLRLPVGPGVAGAAGAAAAAALVNLTWAQNILALEFPCFDLLADRMSAFRVRGGLDPDIVGRAIDRSITPRFAPDVVEAPGDVPAGLVGHDLARRGIVRDDATQVLVISTATACDATAREVAAATDGAVVVPADPAADHPEACLWQAIARPSGGPFRAVHVVAPDDADDPWPWLPGAAGAGEQWTIVGADGPRALDRAPHDDDRTWTTLALELMP